MRSREKEYYFTALIRCLALVLLLSSLTDSFTGDLSAGEGRSLKKATFYVR